MAPVLCYWDIRGLAQPIRFLLAYTGTEYEDKLLSFGPAPEYDASVWYDVKFKLGLDFPNLPYYIDGDFKLCQSHAILKHIARKNGLIGKTDEEQAQADMCAEQIMDLRNALVDLVYNDKYDEMKAGYVAGLPDKLKVFSDFLGKKSWLVGEEITYPDFHLYEMLYQHHELSPESFKDFNNLKDYMKRFQELPAIKAYMASDKYMEAPMNAPMAKFGAK